SGAAFQLGYAFLQCFQTFAGAQQYCLLGLEFLATDDIQAGERTLQHGLELFFHIRHGQAVLAAEQSGSLTADGIHQNLVQHGLSTSVDRWARQRRERRPVYHCSRWRPKRCGRKKRCASARYWRSPLEAMHRYGAPLWSRGRAVRSRFVISRCFSRKKQSWQSFCYVSNAKSDFKRL